MPKVVTVMKAYEPFLRLCAILAPLDLDDEQPLRDAMPGVWLTIGDLRKLNIAMVEAGLVKAVMGENLDARP